MTPTITPISETGMTFQMALMGSSQSKLWTIVGKAELLDDWTGIEEAYFVIRSSAGDVEYRPIGKYLSI